MVALMAVSFAMNVPLFGIELNIIHIVSWCCGILVFTWLFYEFTKDGCLLKRTWNPTLDSMWFSFPLFFCVAAGIPILIIFFLPGGLVGCDLEAYKTVGFDQLSCIYTAVHTTSYILFPLSLIPQTWILHKLRQDSIRPTRNIRLFLFCMMIYSGVTCILYGLYQYNLWQVGTATQATAFVLITHRWLLPLCCGKKELREVEGEDDEFATDNIKNNAAANGNTTTSLPGDNGLDLELPQVPTSYIEEDGTKGNNNKSWFGSSKKEEDTYVSPKATHNSWDDNWLKDDKHT